MNAPENEGQQRVSPEKSRPPGPTETSADILILSDGAILVHNLTPVLAAVLNAINPQDPSIKPRAFAAR